MSVLVVLASARGATVSRDQLVEACWDGRVVSDDAVARAIAKVRALEGFAEPPAFALETVPKIGYRLIPADHPLETRAVEAQGTRPRPPWIPLTLGLAATAGVVLIASAVGLIDRISPPPARVEGAPVSTSEFSDALLVLDERRLKLYLDRGWNPNWKLDSEGNAALHNLMMVCERNPSHDREGLVRVARMMVEAGAEPAIHNKWNDTPLIIAATPRYCGPDHPVVAYLKATMAAHPR